MATTTKKITKSVTLAPGESFTIPPNSEVLYTTNNSAIATDCELPPIITYACYEMTWALNDNQSDSPSLEHQDSLVKSMFINDVEYDLDLDTHAIYTNNAGLLDPDAGNQAVADAFADALPTGIIQIDSVSSDVAAARIVQTLYFLIPDVLATKVRMKIIGPGFPDGLYVFPIASANCIGSGN